MKELIQNFCGKYDIDPTLLLKSALIFAIILGLILLMVAFPIILIVTVAILIFFAGTMLVYSMLE